MIAPRKPTAESAKQPRGDQADDGRLQLRKALFAARPQRRDDHADGRDHDRDHLQQRQMIAEKDEAEDRGLDRLGLEIRRGHDEGAIVHRKQHQTGGDDLTERAEQQPRPEHRRRPRYGIAGHRHHDRKEDDRERKTEQKADIGRAPGPERPRQRPLHRIAGDLAQRSDDGEGNPERGDGEHGEYRQEAAAPCRAGSASVNRTGVMTGLRAKPMSSLRTQGPIRRALSCEHEW